MNAPDPLDHIEVPDGVTKVSMAEDDKLHNAATFTLSREDHTLGDMLRMRLLTLDDVTFAGYQVPHPLVKDVLVKVQTVSRPPTEAMAEATEQLQDTYRMLQGQFKEAAKEAHKSLWER